MTTNFYSELPLVEHFEHATDITIFKDIPNDWHIVITDIKGSTKAVEEGRYRDVNTAGAACIIAVLNAADKTDIPFVFGGDGATLLIPPSILESTKTALIKTRSMIRNSFLLDLRVGIVAVQMVLEQGFSLKIAKVKLSDNANQAMFTGDGLGYAEKIIKDPVIGPNYLLINDSDLPPNLEGFECRWQNIPAKKGEVHSLLVLALGTTEEKNHTYKTVLARVREIYGEDDEQNPVHESNLSLTFSPSRLYKEAKLKNAHLSIWGRLQKTFSVFIANFMGWVLMSFRIKAFNVDWGAYKSSLPKSSDFRKFDEVLRMTLSGSHLQRQKMERVLDEWYGQRRLVYGISVSNAAMLTCLIMDRNNRHFHFVDGAQGGYVTASKQLKQQIKTLPDR